jgi:ribose 5-phosphate isomerase B
MGTDLDLRAIARRAVGRVLGGTATPPAGPNTGVGVDLDPGRPQEGAAGRNRLAPLVTAGCLAGKTSGEEFTIPAGATVTPLAREEAFRQGVRLVPEGWRPGARRVAVGCDHGGRALKAHVLTSLRELGVEVTDLGTHDDAACDYPEFAAAVALAVAEGRADLGVVIDGAGIGSAMAANKTPGVLAANCWDERTARNAREHNHANVLTLGAGHLDAAGAHAVVAAFLSTPAGDGRHARRVDLIRALEVRP